MTPPVAYPQVIEKKRSFWATLAWGISAVLIAVVLCGTVIVIYGMNIADRKTYDILHSMEGAARGLSALMDSLPPILADALDDQRRPDYARFIEVTATSVPSEDRRGGFHASIEIHNRGDEVVSLLSMRIVVVDPNGQPLAERNEWAATPIAGEANWRGPLLPGSKRRFSTDPIHLRGKRETEGLRVEVEVTDVRVWTPADPATRPTTRPHRGKGPGGKSTPAGAPPNPSDRPLHPWRSIARRVDHREPFAA